jgi:hypothetical protein
VKLAVFVIVALAGAAHAESDDPNVLFAAGRYAAAAEIFERRWEAKGAAADGVNAVVSWRTAGRYARAVSLLVRVRARSPLDGDVAETANKLEERLSTLTATATIQGTLAPDAVVRVDDDPAERVGDALVLDVGEHDIVIEQENCKPFVWHTAVYPGARLDIPFAPSCDRKGTLHLYLAGDRGSQFEIDGTPHRATGREADVALLPGTHKLRVASRSRPVLDEVVTIRSKETTALRVRYPWRAHGFGWILGVSGSARTGSLTSGLGLAVTTGVSASQFRATVDFGSVMSSLDRLSPPGHPWFGAMGAIHVTRRPLWHGKLGSHRFALDIDPLAARFDQVRENSLFGIRAGPLEAYVTSWSFLPVTLSADGPYVHFEVTLWPVSVSSYGAGDFDANDDVVFESEHGYGGFLTILGGWRL